MIFTPTKIMVVRKPTGLKNGGQGLPEKKMNDSPLGFTLTFSRFVTPLKTARNVWTRNLVSQTLGYE